MMVDIDAETFSKFMSRRKASPKTIAENVGISRMSVYRALKEGRISLEHGIAIADKYGTTFTEVFGRASVRDLYRIKTLLGI